MQQASDAECTIQDEEILNRLATTLHLTKEEVLTWYRIANEDGWPLAMQPNEKGVFCTGAVCSNKIADIIAKWTILNAGISVQGFNGDDLNKINSSLRFVEFLDFFTTYEESGSSSLENKKLVSDTTVVRAMKVMASSAQGLLSALRSDDKELLLYRCFINVMDNDCASGAGKHSDLDASMGTVVVKLSVEDDIDSSLIVYETKNSRIGTALTLPKGHGVAFQCRFLRVGHTKNENAGFHT